jgi:hypothetical protein
MRRARQVIAPHVIRQRDVVLRIRADPGRRHLEREHLRATEGFDDLRAGIGEHASVENSTRRQITRAIRELVPPLRAFAAHLVELEHAVGLAPARVVRHPPSGDQRPGALVHDAAGLVFVHAEEDEVAREVARLRRAANDLPLDCACEGVALGRRGIAEKRADVAERRGAGAQNVRILDLILQLVKQRRIEPVPHAHMDGQAAWQTGRIQVWRNARERTVIDEYRLLCRTFVLNAAFAEGPVT